jgi:hypothetical protein
MCVEEYLSTYSIIDFLKSKKKKKTLVTLDVICVIVITPNMVWSTLILEQLNKTRLFKMTP